MRTRRAVALTLLLLLGTTAWAGEDGAEARRFVEAYAAGGAARVADLVPASRAEPWRIAQSLLDQGHREVALAYAERLEGPEALAIGIYVAAREAPVDERAVAALAQAGSASDGAAGLAALETLEGLPASSDPLRRVQLSLARAHLLKKLGRAGEAGAAFEMAASSAEDLGALHAAASAYFERGMLAVRERDLEGAAAAWTRYHDAARRTRRPRSIARSHYYLGNVSVELARYEDAARHLGEAAHVYQALESRVGAALALRNLGYLHAERGNYADALRTLESGCDLLEGRGRLDVETSLLSTLAGVHLQLGDGDRAIAAYRHVLKHVDALPESKRGALEAQCRGGIALALGTLGRWEQSEEGLRDALRHYRELEDPRAVAIALHNLGYLHAERKAYGEAAASYRESLVAARAIGDARLESIGLTSLIAALAERGEIEPARELEGRAAELAERLASPRAWTTFHGSTALLRLAAGNPQLSIESAEVALRHHLPLVMGLASDQGARARATHADLYQVPIRAAAARGDAATCARFIETWRVGSQLEAMEGRDRIRAALVPPGLREEETVARARAAASERAYEAAVAEGGLVTIRTRRAELDRARAAVETAVQRIQRDAKRAAGVLYPTPVALTEIQGALGRTDALVLYALMDEDALAVVVTSDDARLVELGPTTAIQQACEAAADALHRSTEDASAALARLDRLVVSRLGLPSEARRLLISPDGALFHVPFAVLLPDVELGYVSSGTALVAARARTGDRGRGVLALGDVNYADGRRLRGLPDSGKEAGAVGDVVLTGAEATEAGLWSTLGERARWRAAHLACHGQVNADRPMQSHLALSLGGDDDGYLTALEVHEHEVPADLVVLSACESGRGRVYQGEGLVGLTHAFAAAGATRVMVSLWKVDDAATCALMTRFHERWNPDDGDGLEAAAALREAQAWIRGHEKWEHPYFWAAWVLWGP